jgi:hypothetical protein
MGRSISWIGVEGRAKAEVLAALDLEDTGRPAQELERTGACAELPNGWVVILSRDFEFASPKRIAELSAGGLAIGCAIEEHVMFSGVRACRNGQALWHVIHDCEDGIYSLATGGEVPPDFGPIRDRLIAQQDKAGGETAGVDYIFDAPMLLAEAVCGFRDDMDDPPPFTELDLAGRPAGARGGWLKALFGRRGRPD